MSHPLLRRFKATGLALVLSIFASEGRSAISTVRIESGLAHPVFLSAPEGDPRLFIVEQAGLIRVRKNGAILNDPFLDLTTEVGGAILGNEERGLLGLAFAPDYASSGLFYVNYTRLSDNVTIIARYQVGANPDVAIPTGETVFSIAQPFANHNGGTVAFGPDDMLYIGMGDGGFIGDPLNAGQRDDILLGKLLRIDVSGGLGTTYSIPAGNPFDGPGDPLDEIWDKGLRNPYRFSFDRQTGHLYIADVGQNIIEEINVEDLDDLGGHNYGWRIMEGDTCFNAASCDMTGLVLPVAQYTHGGVPFRCSVTGGYVYRGAIPEIDGHYFYADFCSNQVWSFVWDGGSGFTHFVERTAELTPDVGDLQNISGFGEDGAGELYIVDRGNGTNGEIFRIMGPTAVPLLPLWGTLVLVGAIAARGLRALRTR